MCVCVYIYIYLNISCRFYSFGEPWLIGRWENKVCIILGFFTSSWKNRMYCSLSFKVNLVGPLWYFLVSFLSSSLKIYKWHWNNIGRTTEVDWECLMSFVKETFHYFLWSGIPLNTEKFLIISTFRVSVSLLENME